MVTHALSIDVEEWFDGNLHRDRTAEVPHASRLEQEWQTVLSLLARSRTRATFFIVGRAARCFPRLVAATAAAGHEVGCHGMEHELVHTLEPAEFAADVGRARSLLRELSGQPVWGFRAPSWSLRRDNQAALEALVHAGYRYSSSVFPFAAGLYGEADAPTVPYRHRHHPLLEFPPAVVRWGPVRLPVGGGTYFRFFPRLTALLFRQTKAPNVFYLHPWELNPLPAPLPPGMPLFSRAVYTFGVGEAARHFGRLLERTAFRPICEVYRDHLSETMRGETL